MASVVAVSAIYATAAADPLPDFGASTLPTVARADPAAKQLVLRDLVNADGQFVVSVPGTPKLSTFEVAWASGTRTAHRYSGAPRPDAAYAISWIDVGDPTKLDADALLDAAMASAVKAYAGTVDGAVLATSVDGFPSRRATIRLASGAAVVARFELADHFLYGIEASDANRGAGSHVRATDADFIVESFQPTSDVPQHAGSDSGWETFATGRYRTLGGLRVGDEADWNVVRRHIALNHANLRACDKKQLIAKADLGDTVTTEFTIASSGTVTSARATGTDTDVARCVAQVIAKIQFPKPRSADVSVSYPVLFRAE